MKLIQYNIIIASIFVLSVANIGFAQHVRRFVSGKIIPSDKEIPVDFGRTHFIVGFPHTTPATSLPVRSLPITDKRVLFSPNDNVLERLTSLIDQEQERIDVAAYLLTDKDIAQALVRAQKRGIFVTIVIDVGGAHDRFNKLEILKAAGIPVFVFKPKKPNSMLVSRMHNKFIVFGKNSGNRPLAWTGSFNFTQSAHKRNQENAVILDDPNMVLAFKTQFEQLKKISTQQHVKKASK